jgi:deazaflavin-dependent oxidoreductase (nitroreductase family)
MRRSGKLRQTVLAVLEFDPQTCGIKAISAWSTSDWYRNIQVSPAVQVETGFTRYAPEQRTLSPEEIAALFVKYRDRHPIFSRIVSRIPGWRIDSTYEEFLELASTLRGIAFRPRQIE